MRPGNVRARNASAWLLPNDGTRTNHALRRDMRRFDDDDEVDLVIVGCGAGGSVLAQRLARRGWKVVAFDAGPFWDPDRDWVSDERGPTICIGPNRGSSPATTRSRSVPTTPDAESADRWCTSPDTSRGFIRPISTPASSTASARTGRSATRTSARTTSCIEHELPVAGERVAVG